MSKNLYIVEGDIEKNFVENMKRCNCIKLGKCVIFNIMQNIIKPTNSIVSKTYNEIFCIIDTDCKEEHNLETLLKNIECLKSIGDVVIFVQCENFEDELSYMLQCSSFELYQKFNIRYQTKKDLKKFLADKIVYSKYIKQSHIKRYCSRPENFKRLILSKNINIRNGIYLINK